MAYLFLEAMAFGAPICINGITLLLGLGMFKARLQVTTRNRFGQSISEALKLCGGKLKSFGCVHQYASIMSPSQSDAGT